MALTIKLVGDESKLIQLGIGKQYLIQGYRKDANGVAQVEGAKTSIGVYVGHSTTEDAGTITAHFKDGVPSVTMDSSYNEHFAIYEFVNV